MKKLLLSLSIACMTIGAWGAKAYHLPVTVTQSDGQPLTIIQFGDEDMNYVTTTDGVLLYQEGTTYYIATVDEYGELVNTSVLAHNAGQRTRREIELIGAQDKAKFFSQSEKRMRKARRERIADDNKFFPHTGTPTALVILADFTDQKFKHDDDQINIEIFDQYLNADGAPSHEADPTLAKNNIGSVKEYFKAMSGGSFVPNFDVKCLVHLSGPMKDYGPGKNDDMNKFIPEVCRLAQQQGVDFSQYDANNDGQVDLVYIIYAGYGQNFSGNDANTIWAKSGGNSYGTFDGKQVYRYGVHCELNFSPAIINSTDYNFAGVPQINGIGLFCHEFSHCMGLPDFYPTTAAAQKQFLPAMEYWDLMDNGEYTYNGYRPTAYTAWEREYMGWMEIETLTEENKGQRISLVNIDRNGGKAYRIYKDGQTSGNEYIIIQNIQSYKWNVNLGNMGHGMLVYHVDFDDSFLLANNSVNNVKGTPRMNVLPADGRLISSYEVDDDKKIITTAMYRASHGGDPYPGTENQFNATSFPMNKGTLTKALLNIQETGGIVTFDFMEESAITQTIPLPAPVPVEESDNVYNITSNQYSHASVMVNRNSTTTMIEKVQLADGDDAFRLTDFVTMSTGFNDLFSLAGYNTVHVDFYPLEDMDIAISLLGLEGTSNAKTVSLTANQWNSVDIPLSDLFSEQFNIAEVAGITLSQGLGQTLYLDNVYFSKTPSSGIDSLKPAITTSSSHVYSLDGRLVGTNLRNLPKGVYIVNNKKVVKQ